MIQGSKEKAEISVIEAKKREIFWTGCGKGIQARLTDGKEIYPHRPDLAELPFWKCDACGNHVGCHHKTNNPTLPLGIIATKELKNARQHIHRILDPLWENGGMSRGKVYAILTEKLGYKFLTIPRSKLNLSHSLPPWVWNRGSHNCSTFQTRYSVHNRTRIMNKQIMPLYLRPYS